MDKKDAEYLRLLKIDCLGLRTLSILEEVAEQLGKPYKWFYTIPTDDKATFDMMKNLRLNGVFQFEGQALQISRARKKSFMEALAAYMGGE